MCKIGAKGFRVVQDGKGKATLERIPFYGRDASAKIRGKKSKKVRVVSQMQLASLFRGGSGNGSN